MQSQSYDQICFMNKYETISLKKKIINFVHFSLVNRSSS